MSQGIPAGDLDRRITLQRSSPARDAFGAKVAGPLGWADLASVKAKHTPVSDGERIRAQQNGASITDRFLIRWSKRLADLGARDQLVFEGRTYGITGVKPVGRRVAVEITAIARAD
ncbi:MAG: phage head closure protein [Caulobacterales bacterium]|nr:phage head closure protein [Caulobacterales bacterium]